MPYVDVFLGFNCLNYRATVSLKTECYKIGFTDIETAAKSPEKRPEGEFYYESYYYYPDYQPYAQYGIWLPGGTVLSMAPTASPTVVATTNKTSSFYFYASQVSLNSFLYTEYNT